MLLGTDKDGRTRGTTQHRGPIQLFYKKYGSGLKKKKLEEKSNKFLFGTKKDGITAWHRAAERSN